MRSAVTCADIIPDSANEASSLSPRSLFLFFLPCQSPSPHVDDLPPSSLLSSPPLLFGLLRSFPPVPFCFLSAGVVNPVSCL